MREHHTDTRVHFELQLSEENFSMAVQEGLEKKFKLTNFVSTGNMHLFDHRGKMEKYDSPEKSTFGLFFVSFPVLPDYDSFSIISH